MVLGCFLAYAIDTYWPFLASRARWMYLVLFITINIKVGALLPFSQSTFKFTDHIHLPIASVRNAYKILIGSLENLRPALLAKFFPVAKQQIDGIARERGDRYMFRNNRSWLKYW